MSPWTTGSAAPAAPTSCCGRSPGRWMTWAPASRTCLELGCSPCSWNHHRACKWSQPLLLHMDYLLPSQQPLLTKGRINTMVSYYGWGRGVASFHRGLKFLLGGYGNKLSNFDAKRNCFCKAWLHHNISRAKCAIFKYYGRWKEIAAITENNSLVYISV